MKKALIIIIAAVALLIAGTAAAAIGYMNSADYKSDKLPENTIINGIDCSNMTYDAAEDKMADSWNKHKVIVTGVMDEQLAVFADFGCKYDIADQIRNIKKDNLVAAGLNHYLDLPLDVHIAMKVTETGKDFEKEVKKSEFLVGGNVTDSQNAYVDLEDPEFPIIDEVYGTKPNLDKFFGDLVKCIETGDMMLKYDKNNYLSIPEIKSDDRELLAYQKYCKKFLSQKIIYEFGDDIYRISATELQKMFKDDMSGNVNDKAVAKFVSKLAKEYDTAGEKLHIKSLTGKEFDVNGGTYGWIIDQDGEAKQLKKDLESHKKVRREPVYLQKGEGKYSHSIGKTYVDVDITLQKVNYFKDGKRVFKCDCVTGNEIAGHSTPTGLYYLNSKSRNITLVGGGKKGSKGYYESPVSYWMPFIGQSIGLHDASWRSTFGGTIYKTAGSHGCINLPPDKAGELYDILEIGTPVIVHH